MISMRPAAVEDAEALAELIAGVAADSLLPKFSIAGRANFLAEHTAAKMVERLSGDFRYHVAHSDGRLIGVIGVRGGTHLFHLFVARDFQRQGVARSLWERAVAEARTEGHSIVTVNSSRSAVAAYEKFGFRVAAPVQDVGGVLFIPMRRDTSAAD